MATTTSRAGNDAITALPIRQSQPSGLTAGSISRPDAAEPALPLLGAVEPVVDAGQRGSSAGDAFGVAGRLRPVDLGPQPLALGDERGGGLAGSRG